MKWIEKQRSILAAALVVAVLGACFVLSGVSAKAEPAPAASGVSTSTTALSASAPEVPAPGKIHRLHRRDGPAREAEFGVVVVLDQEAVALLRQPLQNRLPPCDGRDDTGRVVV